MVNEIKQGELAGQVALVTGGGRGLGRTIAQALATAGAAVAVTARTASQLTETVAQIESAGGRAIAIAVDVTDRQAVERMVVEIEQQLGQIEILVNNAGINGARGNFWEIDPEEWWRIVEVNVRGVMLCTHAILPGMIARRHGRIINTGSNAAIQPSHNSSAYSTSKAALLRFSESLAVGVKEHGIHVFCFSPGLVHTGMTDEMWQNQGTNRIETDWTPAERSGELIVLLASGKADSLHGRYIHVREDDITDMLKRAEEIQRDDLHTLRLRK